MHENRAFKEQTGKGNIELLTFSICFKVICINHCLVFILKSHQCLRYHRPHIITDQIL